MATIFYRRDRRKWYVEYRTSTGKTVRRAAGTNPRQAELVKKEIEIHLARGEVLPTRRELIKEVKREIADQFPKPPDIPEITIARFVKEYLKYSKQNKTKASRQDDERRLRFFQDYNDRFLGRKNLLEITPCDIEAYRGFKLRSCKPRSVEGYLISLYAALNKAMEWGYLLANPATGLYRIRNKEVEIPRFLDREERETLLETARGHPAFPIIGIAVFAGLRSKELRQLKWQDVDLEAGILYVRRTKGHRDRTVPINTRLREILKSSQKKSGLVFPNRKRKEHDKDSLRKVVNRIYEKAGIDASGLHVLRHTFASHLAMNGVSVFKVSQWLGHADVKTTLIYAHLAPVDQDIDRQ